MKPWVYVAALILPGGSLILLALWIRRRARDAGDSMIASKIVPPVVKFAGHDDSLRVRTIARRKAADAIRTRAGHIESGAPVSDVLRMVAK